MNNAMITPIENCEVASVKVANTSATKFYFPDLPNLRGKKVYGIEVFKVAEVSKDASGNAVCNATAQLKACVTLSINGSEKVKELPVNTLVTSANGGRIKNFADFNIDYQKSFVQFSDTTSLVANEVVLFAFYYKD